MSEIFVNQIITEAGYSIIAAATSSNPVEYIGALSNATIPSDPTDRDSYTGRAGQVDAASATDNVARIVASYLNNDLDSPQPVKAIALLGKLSSYSDAQAVVVAYAADPDSEIVLPRSSAPAQITRFAFNLTFNPGSTISVFQTGDATVEDLLDLVSCHKPGQPTAGADQDVYGKKYFKQTAYFGGGQVSIAADVSGGQYNLALMGMKPELDGVQPRFVVGYSSTRDRNEITFQGTKTWSFYKEDFSPISAGCTIGFGTQNPPKINADTVTADSVGTNARPVTGIFATTAYCTNLHATENVYADYLHGVLPAPRDVRPSASDPVEFRMEAGTIALIYAIFDSPLEAVYKATAGAEIQAGAGGIEHINIATLHTVNYGGDDIVQKWEGNTGIADLYKFKLLCSVICEVTPYGSKGFYALAVCTGEAEA